MAPYALSAILLVVSTAYVSAQDIATFPATPLASLHFPSPSEVPYQVDPGNLARGNQYGYNLCNSTTEGQTSRCQTSWVNALNDFCLWGPPEPNSVIGDSEGEAVAWCTSKGHGTRLMPAGTLKGAQLLKTPDYIMITGLVDQTLIDIQADDYGGEYDPHGQDLRGNPIGGLMYSTGFDGNVQQVLEWTNFMGGSQFCIKVCRQDGPNAARLCEHKLDRIGCAYNAPTKYTVGAGYAPGEFEVCESDSMLAPGLYVENGVTLTYTQPPESLGEITKLPYEPSIPPSSKCATTASAALFADLPAPSAITTSGAATATATATGSGASTRASSAASRSTSGSAAAASSTSQSGGAASLGMSVVAGAVGVVLSMAVWA
ncbi:hypothetical protein OF83DRAFT_1188624 [Amylostereum chailletii]|nr:hypothetical protein OF83DRAFT_1188624 [Amylostereum chailletii]